MLGVSKRALQSRPRPRIALRLDRERKLKENDENGHL
jgi:hypothetical protein